MSGINKNVRRRPVSDTKISAKEKRVSSETSSTRRDRPVTRRSTRSRSLSANVQNKLSSRRRHRARSNSPSEKKSAAFKNNSSAKKKLKKRIKRDDDDDTIGLKTSISSSNSLREEKTLKKKSRVVMQNNVKSSKLRENKALEDTAKKPRKRLVSTSDNSNSSISRGKLKTGHKGVRKFDEGLGKEKSSKKHKKKADDHTEKLIKKPEVIELSSSDEEQAPKKKLSRLSRNPEGPKCESDQKLEEIQPVHEVKIPEDAPNCHSCNITLLPPYSIHVHPSLAISVCAECSQMAYAVEGDVRDIKDELKQNKNLLKDKNFETNVDTCCLCCGESTFEDYNEAHEEILSKLFLCDTCPRAFCGRCILICTNKKIKTLYELDHLTSEWECLVCSMNHEESEHMMPGLTQMHNEFKNFTASHGVGKDEHLNTDEKAEKLIAELDEMETSIEEAMEKLEEENLALQRKNIYNELKSEKYPNKENDSTLEEEVEEEMEIYQRRWKAHHTRLVEALPPLQEALEEAGVNVLAFYNTRNGVEKDADKSTRRAADKEVDARAASLGFSRCAFRGASGYKSPNPKVYSFDLEDVPPDLLKVEEINTTENALEMMIQSRKTPGSTTRASFGGVQTQRMNENEDENYVEEREKDLKKQFLKAIKYDDVELDDMKISPDSITKVNENQDRSLEKMDLKSVNTAQRRVIQEELWLSNGYRKSQKKQKGIINKTKAICEKIEVRTPEVKKIKKRVAPILISDDPVVEEKNYVSPQDSDRTKGSFYFEDSCFVLNSAELKINPYASKSISVHKDLSERLKAHQKDGVQFMWNNICKSFVDLSHFPPAMQSIDYKVCGCIIAHSMGLGKTLQVLAFLHTLFVHPALKIQVSDVHNSLPLHLREDRKNRIFHRALICVPVNTIANWIQEFNTWYGKDPPFKIHVIESHRGQHKYLRPKIVEEWYKYGGILLTSFDLYVSLVGERLTKQPRPTYQVTNTDLMFKALQSPGPDLVIIDEAHQVLKKNSNKNFKALTSMSTKRRIALTGTPIQNNLIEYFHLVNWIQPGILGTIQEFERKFAVPMKLGMASDSSLENKKGLLNQSRELHNRLAPFVHRLDANILRKDLRFMQQAVIHVRMSRAQARLYRAFRKHPEHESVGMIEQCSKLRPVYNHPGCLMMKKGRDRNSNDNLSYSLSKPQEGDRKWWHRVYEKHPDLANIENGGKIGLLLQIIAHADLIDDKVVVFSQSIATLDFIESVLNSERWEQHVSSLNLLKINSTWGPWRKNIEYLRIDGSTSALERGELISSFNNGNSDGKQVENSVKLFLISTAAGGIGTNLAAANRVIIFDTHFNPAVDMQALYRCYRYGQTKPVYAYRFLAEGTMEEKIYSRQVNKSGLSLRVIDNIHPESFFSKDELTNLQENDTWVCCDRCQKWRLLPPETDAEALPENWFCEMNVDTEHASCDAPERDQQWYQEQFLKKQLNKQATQNNHWARCILCKKMRMLPDGIACPQSTDWHCGLNVYDAERSTCAALERSQEWYANYFASKKVIELKVGGSVKDKIDSNNRFAIDDEKKEFFKKRDVILDRLVTANKKLNEKHGGSKKQKGSWISRYLFHDMLLIDSDLRDEVNEGESIAKETALTMSKTSSVSSATSNTWISVSNVGDVNWKEIDKTPKASAQSSS